MHPPRRNPLSPPDSSETAGGTLLVVGPRHTPCQAALIGTMITAIRKVHLPNGVWVSKGGYEYNLVLIAALLAIAEEGPGDLSLDEALGRPQFAGLRGQSARWRSERQHRRWRSR